MRGAAVREERTVERGWRGDVAGGQMWDGSPSEPMGLNSGLDMECEGTCMNRD